MEQDIGLCDLLQRTRVHAVDGSMYRGDGGHNPHGVALCGLIGLRTHGNGSQEQLRRAILGGGDSRNLTEQIQPSTDPTDLGHPFFRREVFASEVQASRCRVGGDEFGDGQRDAHTACAGDEPAPHGGSSTSCVQGVGEGGGDTREEAGDRDGEGEAGKP